MNDYLIKKLYSKVEIASDKMVINTDFNRKDKGPVFFQNNYQVYKINKRQSY